MAIHLYNKWDVIVLPYPLTGAMGEIGARRRPALVVSGGSLQQDYNLYWVLMITSKSGNTRDELADVAIDDWEIAGLPVPSIVRTTKILTVQARQVIRSLGSLAPGDRARVTLELSRFVG